MGLFLGKRSPRRRLHRRRLHLHRLLRLKVFWAEDWRSPWWSCSWGSVPPATTAATAASTTERKISHLNSGSGTSNPRSVFGFGFEVPDPECPLGVITAYFDP